MFKKKKKKRGKGRTEIMAEGKIQLLREKTKTNKKTQTTEI